jgi:hypothetical protein
MASILKMRILPLMQTMNDFSAFWSSLLGLELVALISNVVFLA